MKKLRLTENQVQAILQREKDLEKKKVLKINEGQYKRLFQNEGVFGKDDASQHIPEAETEVEEINPLEFAQELIVFVRDTIKRKSRPFPSYWEKLGITKRELIKKLKENGVFELGLDETTGWNVIKARKSGFRKAVKTIYNIVVADRDTIQEYETPETTWSQGDDTTNEPMGIPTKTLPRSERKFLNVKNYSGDPNDKLIFMVGVDKYLYVIDSDDLKSSEDLSALNQYDDDNDLDYAEIRPTDETIVNYLNAEFKDRPLSTITSDFNDFENGEVVRVNRELEQYIIEESGWYDDGLEDMFNNAIIPEMDGMGATSADASGQFTGGASFSGPIKKQIGYTPGEAMGNATKPEIINEPDYVTDEDDNKEELELETTSMGGSGGLNTGRGGNSIEYDVNGFEDSSFMNAGNKLKKTEGSMPMIKREGVNESYKEGQTYTNGNGRATIRKVGTDTLNVDFSDLSGSRNRNIEPHQLSGWELFLEGKKVLKVTEAQMKAIMETDNQTATAYPGGGFVKLDDCTKLNNNKVAQNGGCSQGDDDVVTLSKTQDSVVAK
jgi:hypothetical protein